MTKYTPLTEAVIRRIGGPRAEALQTLGDVANHGADAGYAGFTYYRDTLSFFKRHRALIMAALREDSDSFGESISTMLSSWRSLKGINEPLLALTEKGDDYDTVANALAWYALERAASETESANNPTPLCAQAMGCLCAGHARGNSASLPCDTRKTV